LPPSARRHEKPEPVATGNSSPGPKIPSWLGYLVAGLLALLPYAGNLTRLATNYLGYPAADASAYRAQLTFAIRTLGAGEMPLWNPHTFCGSLFFPSTHATLWSPVNLPILLLVPLPLGMNLCLLAASIVLATGTAWYLRRLQCAWLPSLVGAGLAAGCGFLVCRVFAGHFTIACTLVWFPWLLGTMESLFRRPTLSRAAALAALAAVMYFGGHSQIAYYAGLLLGVRVLLHVWQNRSEPPALRRLAVLLVCSVLGAAALAAVELLPVLHALRNSARTGEHGEDWTRFFAFPPENWVHLVSPAALGMHPNYLGRWYWWEVTPYFGIVALGFALFELIIQVRERRWSPTAWLFTLSVLLTCGAYLPVLSSVLPWIPGWGLFRGHSKLAGFTAWFGCVLAAHGLQRWLMTSGRSFLLLALLGFLAIFALGGSLAVSGEPYASLLRSETIGAERMLKPEWDAGNKTLIVTIWVRAAVLASVAALLVMLTGSASRFRIRVVVAALLIADVLIFANAAQRKMLGQNEYRGPITFWQFAASVREEARVDIPRTFTSGMLFGADSPSGQDINISRYYNTYVAAVLGESPDYPHLTFEAEKDDPLLDLSNFTYIGFSEKVHFPRNFPVRDEGTTTGVHLYRRTSALPRAYVVSGSQAVENDEHAIYNALRERKLDFHREVLLTGPGAETQLPQGTFTPASAKYIGTREVRVSAPGSGWLVLTDTYDPLWRATVNGKPRQVVRANSAFRAVKVEAGDQVVFRLEHTWFRVGAVVSGLSWVLAILAAAYAVATRYRRAAPQVNG